MKQKSLFSAYIELTKPRILMLVLVTTTLGFYLPLKEARQFPQGEHKPIRLIKKNQSIFSEGEGRGAIGLFTFLLIGVAMVTAGSAALNHYLEREFDSKMLRTKNRPIPTGLIAPEHALSFGISLALLGIFILYVKVNILTSFLSLLTSFLYIMVYTPMKRVSWLNTTVGAVPGAIPPLGGWAAATGGLSFEAGILFLILFLWQHPHFYAIAWMLRDDYKRGGFKMLPVVEPDGRRMFDQILWFSVALIPVSLVPFLTGMSGAVYFIGTLTAGLGLLWVSRNFIRTRSLGDAKKLLRATVIYLPVLLFLIVLDVSF